MTNEVVASEVVASEVLEAVKTKKPRSKKVKTKEVLPEVTEEVLPEVTEEKAPETKGLPSLADQIEALAIQKVEDEIKKLEPRNENVWGNVKILFDQGKTNKEVLALIHEMYGNTKTSYACIAWYRNKYNKMAKDAKLSPKEVLSLHLKQFGVDEAFINNLVTALK